MARRSSRVEEASQAYLVTTAEPTWTDEQLAVIRASHDARLLVDAGPGTGKTAVACARIAYLVEHAHLEPTDIWLVSFTRTAVHELRSRIGSYVGDPGRAAGIRIATIDSHAWAIQSGFRQDATLSGSFEDNIQNVTELIRSHEGVFEYLSSVRHLLIDEAQDVVGPRCELLLELIAALPQKSGVTVLADEAQAIYGFAEDDVPDKIDGTLPELIREHMPEFEERELTEIHRTADPTLRELFSQGRLVVRKRSSGGKARLEKIRELVQTVNHGDLGSHRADLENLPGDLDKAFLLFRKRGEALEASGYLEQRPHRLRMSGLPVMIHDWVGRLLWDWTSPTMDRSEFEKRWRDRMKSRADLSQVDAWQSLVRIVGLSTEQISVEKLAQRLSGGSPPVDLCNPDFGPGGPIIGTIHGAKGREAEDVRLYLPPTYSGTRSSKDLEEEARVMFVGATRARRKLMVGTGATKALARRLDPSGRAYTPYPFQGSKQVGRACVEVGRAGDIDAVGLVGRQFFEDDAAARRAQAHILTLVGGISTAEAHLGTPERDWRYLLLSTRTQNQPLCYLNPRVNYDMFSIAKLVDATVHKGCMKPPRKIPYIRTFGARTIALAPDDPIRETLHAPWRDSGFLLAPLAIGYGMVYFAR